MKRLFLRFDSRAEFEDACLDAGIEDVDAPEIMGPNGLHLSVIGPVRKPVLDENGEQVVDVTTREVETGEYDEYDEPITTTETTETPRYTGDDRFHVNALVPGDLPEAFAPFIIEAPANPVRVFA